ncbi:MAG TPA: GWxTD domain-containing protein [Terriglobales bacterium]|nr:GWxTD domain-containing protein [Terriglobales bacterium]
MYLDELRNRACIAIVSASFILGIAGITGLASPVFAQEKSKADKSGKSAADGQKQDAQKPEEADPLKRPLSDKQVKEQQKALRTELGKTYKRWLDQDVRWIITEEERAAFKQLSNDEERDQFIEQFWLRRDPTPDTLENDYKEEHYRRIAYANEHYPSGVPGWKTDRGRIYIMYGKPDEVESHPTGGQYNRPMEEGGGSTSTYPFEKWRYRYLEGIGQDINIEFVDTCSCNEYHMTVDRSEKDALKNVPGAGLTMYEQMMGTDKSGRFKGVGLEQLGLNPLDNSVQTKQFDRLDLFARLQKAPTVKFKDLEEVVSHKIRINLLPFDVRADFIKVTTDTVLVPITISIKNRDITFVNKEGVQRGVVNIFGRVTTLTGRVAQTFEDVVSVDQPAELLPKILDNPSVYWKALPLRPGRYRVDIVLKDVNGDRAGTWTKGLVVPEYDEDKLASSTLILADLLEKVPTKSVGAGNFIIGDTKVRPRVEAADGKPSSFKRAQRVNFWMQVYNLGIDQATKRPDATIEYELVNTVSNKTVVHSVETTKQMGNLGEQITLEKSMPLGSLEPGTYRITIKVADNVSKQNISPSARFAVE